MNRNTLSSVFSVATVIMLLSIAPARAETVSTEEALREISYGRADAPILIYGFESLSCPHCREFHYGAWPQIRKEYVDSGKVRFVLRDFPHNAQGFLGLLTARCLGPQRVKGMVKILFANQSQWAFLGGDKFYEALGRYARLGGLSNDDFRSCQQNEDLIKGIRDRVKEATEKYEIRSVPAFLIGTGKQIESGAARRINGAAPFETFDRAIKQALAETDKK